MQRFDSVREKDFNLHFCTRNRNYIQSIDSDCRNKGESLHLHTLIRMLDLTFRAGGLSLEFWYD